MDTVRWSLSLNAKLYRDHVQTENKRKVLTVTVFNPFSWDKFETAFWLIWWVIWYESYIGRILAITCEISKSESKSWFMKIPNKVPEWVQTVEIKSEFSERVLNIVSRIRKLCSILGVFDFENLVIRSGKLLWLSFVMRKGCYYKVVHGNIPYGILIKWLCLK